MNLGCGRCFHASWTNLDFSPASSDVLQSDLRRGIPFPDESFDVVYHSHALEHFGKSAAPSFLRECYRVLRPAGILRVAVPDLEQMASLYLDRLSKALEGDESSMHDYDWIMLELYDQTVREQSGGAMSEYLRQENLPNRDFVVSRIGAEARSVIDGKATLVNGRPPTSLIKEKGEASRPRTAKAPLAGRAFRRLVQLFRRNASNREENLKKVLASEYELLRMARFRASGEIHLWMYDRYSLSRLLRDAGFLSPTVQGAAESKIPNWTTFCLDTEPDGAVRKPDSLFMEATRP